MKTKLKISTVEFSDPVLKNKIQLKIEKLQSDKIVVSVILPEEKNFFRGVKFSEVVKLEKLKNGNWIKTLRAKFGAGAEELFGVNEINEESELESRDVRIIAFIEKSLA